MVDFKQVPLTDQRLTNELCASFLNVDQLFEWKVTEGSETHTGLVIVGEKAHPQGFESMTDFEIDSDPNEIPIAKVYELSKQVLAEFERRRDDQTGIPSGSHTLGQADRLNLLLPERRRS